MLFSLAIVFAIAFPSLAQDQQTVADEAKKRQAKMMETQMFMSQLMQLGYSSELRKELEVVDDQLDSVKELAQKYQQEMMEFHSKNSKLGIEIQKLYQAGKHAEAQELGKEYQQKSDEFNDNYMDKAAEVLLPHQVKRLKQIAKQQGARYTNEFQDEFGIPSAFADEMGLSAEQKKRLVDVTTKAREDYYAAIEDAKKKAMDKIMSALTSEQKEKMQDILGDEFDQQAAQRRNRSVMMSELRKRKKARKANDK